jgi:hypothetical protein
MYIVALARLQTKIRRAKRQSVDHSDRTFLALDELSSDSNLGFRLCRLSKIRPDLDPWTVKTGIFAIVHSATRKKDGGLTTGQYPLYRLRPSH